jgi:two-component system, NarL family, response regulator NreC
MKIKILMIDDHPSMLEGYKIILSYNPFGYEVETTAAYSSQKAYEIITNNGSPTVFDIVFLDYSLPAFEEKKIRNGEDLSLLVKKHFPLAKIMLITSHAEAILLYNIVQRINPEGFLVKSDFTADELLVAFDAVLKGEIYHSQTVKNSIKEMSSSKMYLDSINRQILSLIAQGLKTKSMPEYLRISLSAIEKRKIHIKEYFNIKKGNDEDILREARKMGLI